MHPVVRGYGLGKGADLKARGFLVKSEYASEVVEGVMNLEAAETWGETIEAAKRVEDYIDGRGNVRPGRGGASGGPEGSQGHQAEE
ncbi:MAG: hypothetical protein Q8O40_00380 [Chloroflexota bacterium]|nr:hypothetical protein [Chloroflexota bacterium]